jgi:hypothetical protein
MVSDCVLRREAFGVRFEIRTPRELAGTLDRRLPPSNRLHRGEVPRTGVFELRREGAAVVLSARGLRTPLPDAGAALDMLGDAIESYVALRAPDHVFVHAGVVALGAHALVLPGRSGQGKSTLVTALVAAGASYASDEWAVVDGNGFLHPYPRPLRLRTPGGTFRIDPRETDARIARRPLRLALLVVTQHCPGASLDLTPLGPSRACLSLVAHAPAVRARPARALPALRRALNGTLALAGSRGEATEAAGPLLELLRRCAGLDRH